MISFYHFKCDLEIFLSYFMYIYEHFVPYYTVPFHAHRAQYWEEINYLYLQNI